MVRVLSTGRMVRVLTLDRWSESFLPCCGRDIQSPYYLTADVAFRVLATLLRTGYSESLLSATDEWSESLYLWADNASPEMLCQDSYHNYFTEKRQFILPALTRKTTLKPSRLFSPALETSHFLPSEIPAATVSITFLEFDHHELNCLIVLLKPCSYGHLAMRKGFFHI